ncbi:hypothetical protein JYU34_003055 [Plutella xylostella]|uniref:Uncharacterized protein n=1 Tax=Plutella xylostella TaxID=51655 RepID=A0ABQ7QZ22_PLUXY|nr:hypothetical protein JYU34_003055 [Plutella xylostella]
MSCYLAPATSFTPQGGSRTKLSSYSGAPQPSPLEHISPGKRYIVVHAGSETGFVPNALLIFSTKSRLADYHHDMNAENFGCINKQPKTDKSNTPIRNLSSNTSTARAASVFQEGIVSADLMDLRTYIETCNEKVRADLSQISTD